MIMQKTPRRLPDFVQINLRSPLGIYYVIHTQASFNSRLLSFKLILSETQNPAASRRTVKVSSNPILRASSSTRNRRRNKDLPHLTLPVERPAQAIGIIHRMRVTLTWSVRRQTALTTTFSIAPVRLAPSNEVRVWAGAPNHRELEDIGHNDSRGGTHLSHSLLFFGGSRTWVRRRR